VGSGQLIRKCAFSPVSGARPAVAARKIDATIRRPPGFEDVALVESWLERETRVPTMAAGHTGPAGKMAPASRAA
jgi:hypothetical protein